MYSQNILIDTTNLDLMLKKSNYMTFHEIEETFDNLFNSGKKLSTAI